MSGRRQCALQHLATLSWIFNREPGAAARFGELRKADWLQVATVLRVAQKNHLLPLDLTERIVFDHDDLDRKLVLDTCREFAHKHGETAITHECDALALRVSDLSGDCVRESVRHRGKVPAEREQLPAADLDLSGNRGGNRAAVGGENGVITQSFAELP